MTCCYQCVFLRAAHTEHAIIGVPDRNACLTPALSDYIM